LHERLITMLFQNNNNGGVDGRASVFSLGIVALLLVDTAAGIIAPNTSLATVPTAYFGGNTVRRGNANIEMLAKMRLVMIEKWEGRCWQGCLANENSSFCKPTCGVENSILDTLERVKAKNSHVATVLYWNTLLAFPFYTAVGKFAAANALTIDSTTKKPIKIRNDNGMENIGVYGFDVETGVDLYMETVKNLTSTGLVDGFFGDKWESGAKLSNHGGQWQICNHECGNVTPEQATRWNEGKARALKLATEHVGSGPYFSNGDSFEGIRANLNGHWGRDKDLFTGDPRDIIADVKLHLKAPYGTGNHTYFYMSCTGDQHWTTNPNDPDSLKSACDDQVLGRFLLAVEPGCFLGTNGWNSAYERPLGNPHGPAVYTAGSPSTLHRNFSSGTYVVFTYKGKNDGSSIIYWGGRQPPPPPPPPPPVECGGVKSSILFDTTFAQDDVVKHSTQPSADACCDACSKETACAKWAWHSEQKDCHLHSQKASIKSQKGTTSGVLKR